MLVATFAVVGCGAGHPDYVPNDTPDTWLHAPTAAAHSNSATCGILMVGRARFEAQSAEADEQTQVAMGERSLQEAALAALSARAALGCDAPCRFEFVGLLCVL